MSTEVLNTREHLRNETYALLEAIILRDTDRAREHAVLVVQLINHLDSLEKRAFSN